MKNIARLSVEQFLFLVNTTKEPERQVSIRCSSCVTRHGVRDLPISEVLIDGLNGRIRNLGVKGCTELANWLARFKEEWWDEEIEVIEAAFFHKTDSDDFESEFSTDVYWFTSWYNFSKFLNEEMAMYHCLNLTQMNTRKMSIRKAFELMGE